MVADYLHICPCGKESQKEIRPGKIHTSVDFDRARALNMVFVTTHISTALIAHGNLSAARGISTSPGLLAGPSAVSAARGISATTLPSHGPQRDNRREGNFHITRPSHGYKRGQRRERM